MRLATALFGHAGLEWDLTACSAEEQDAVAAWVTLHKELRSLLHSGDVVRADPLTGPAGAADDGEVLHGVVSPDRSEAVLAWVRTVTSPDAVPGQRRLPWLEPARTYRVRVRTELPPPRTIQMAPPGWWDAACADGAVVSGAVLARSGLAMPVLGPGQALVLHCTAEPS
jgi:alpha-galactosidase